MLFHFNNLDHFVRKETVMMRRWGSDQDENFNSFINWVDVSCVAASPTCTVTGMTLYLPHSYKIPGFYKGFSISTFHFNAEQRE